MVRMLVGIFLGMTLVSASAGAEGIKTRDVQIAINDVFVPDSQKSNGESYVVISGMFPNSCYSWNRAEVKHVSQSTHEVRVFAKVSEAMCLMVLVPFTKEVVIGELSRGEHTLKFINGDGTFQERTLNIP